MLARFQVQLHVVGASLLHGTLTDYPKGTFSTLVAAVTAAGLVDALDGEGPFTVFAPTDDAFAAYLEKAGRNPPEYAHTS